jgi:hypothetical protein
MRVKLLMIFFSVLFSVSTVNSQHENILCSEWCKAANQVFQSEFGDGDCLYVIMLTPQNQIIFTGWCNYLLSIRKSRSRTYSSSGLLLESLYDPNGWVESSYLTGNETTLFHSLEDIYPSCNTGGPCDTEIEMIQGVECELARVLSTGQLLFLKEFSAGIDGSQLTAGKKARISYVTLGGASFCIQGETPVRVTCLESVEGNTNFSICTTFEEYNTGAIVPQGSPPFSLFSGGSSQNAQIVNNLASSRNKSLKFVNGSNIDFNITRTLTEEHVARIDWNMYIPDGKSGRFGIETNNAANYAFWAEINNQTLTLWRNVNNIPTQISGSSFFPSGKWNQMAIIFQPFDDEIEFWVNYTLIYTVSNYESNKIEDLNFYTISNQQNTEYHIDDLCYKEWSTSGPCTLQFDPVCINNEIYSNTCFAGFFGYSILEYYPGECGPPSCTALSYPANGALNIPVTVTLQWPTADRVLFYNILVGTSPGNSDIANDIVHHSQTSYNLPDLPHGTKIYVSLSSSNSTEFTFCSTTSFTTVSNIQIPTCSAVTYPQNNAVNIPTTFNLSWSAVSGATGYKLKVSYNNGNTIILNNLNVSNVTNYQLNNLPNNTVICAKITPYNTAGENQACTESCFTTIAAVQIPGCAMVTYPLNNATNIPTTVSLQWTPSFSAGGYILRAGTSPGGSDLLNNINIGNVTGYTLNNLPSDRTICFTLIPYNEAGQNLNCTHSCFTTAMVSGTDDDITKAWHIYPNPTSGYIQIKGIESGTYAIADITGKILLQGPLNNDQISLHAMHPGIYILTLTHATAHRVLKMEKL